MNYQTVGRFGGLMSGSAIWMIAQAPNAGVQAGGFFLGLAGLATAMLPYLKTFKDDKDLKEQIRRMNEKLDEAKTALSEAERRAEANRQADRAEIKELREENRKLTGVMLRRLDSGVETLKNGQETIKSGQDSITMKVVQLPRALIVDDDPATCKQMIRLMKIAGFDGDCAESLKEARELLHPRLHWVVADVGLGDGTGLDLLRDIRSQGLITKVAIITGSPDERTLAEADESFADIILSKPFNEARFLAEVKRLGEIAPRPHAADVAESTENRPESSTSIKVIK